MKQIICGVFMLVAVVAMQSCVVSKTAAQLEQERIELINKLDSERFTFETDYVIPSGGFQPRHLTTIYDLTLSPDTLKSYLPYFGVAYDAEHGSNESPLIFTSTDFLYEIFYNKRNRNWIINITVNDKNHPIYYSLTIWENGKGDLIVLDTSRQRITFHGEIKMND